MLILLVMEINVIQINIAISIKSLYLTNILAMFAAIIQNYQPL